MSIYKIRQLSSIGTPDDTQLFVVRRDLSGGVNTRQFPTQIGENQGVTLSNVDIGVPAKRRKRPGSVLIGNDVGSVSIVRLHNYEITNDTPQLLMYENTTLYKWTGAGNWSSIKADFFASTICGMITCKMSGLSPDDTAIVQNGVDNAFLIESDATTVDLGNINTSPPISTVMCWYRNRVWVLLNGLLYYSSAYPSDYSTAFDRTTNSFRIPIGTEMGLVPTRDMGIICLGDLGIWSLAPSSTPIATDRPEPIVTNMGCVSKQGWCPIGDDIYFFAQDGLRSLKRTQLDKLQTGTSYPISYFLKTEFEEIAWAYKDRICMEYFDNKLFITVPLTSSTFKTWVYYPAINAFSIISGWSPRCYVKYKVGGEERFYYGKHGDGTVYRGWYGYTDEGTNTTNGTKITYSEESRREDFGQPLVKKNGGELEVVCQTSGDYDFDIYANFDNGGYNKLGVINLEGTYVTFPLTFPVDFSSATLKRGKFHLDSYGAFRDIQTKFEHDATNADDEIAILEHSIVTFKEEYENE